MSTNKVYGNNPNFLIVEKKTRWEINSSHKFKTGIDESMSIDNCTHSFFGVKILCRFNCSRIWKKFRFYTVCFITGPNHSGMDFYLI